MLGGISIFRYDYGIILAIIGPTSILVITIIEIPRYLKLACAVKMEAQMEEDALGKKINSRSIIWNYFELKLDEKGYIRKDLEDRPVCRTCKRSVSAKNGNTSNLFTHLRDHHARLYADATSLFAQERQDSSSQSPTSSRGTQEKEAIQLTLVEAIDRAKQYPHNSPQALELNEAICYFLAKGMHPLSTVEEPGFRNLIYKLNPRYHCPSRKHFSEKELPQLYTYVRDAKIKPQMEEVSHFSITTDLWTSASHDPYLSLTMH